MSYMNHKHLDIGRFGRLFGSSAPMARTLRPKETKDISRARARARETFLIRVQFN